VVADESDAAIAHARAEARAATAELEAELDRANTPVHERRPALAEAARRAVGRALQRALGQRPVSSGSTIDTQEGNGE
jgi:hypothetical protein